MPKLPQKKVGLVACSGEELAEGTISRQAAFQVLEQLRPDDTVTICLPLFLAGEERERAFARFYPTIAVDGCDKRCAARATEKYSAPPAASLVITDFIAENELPKPHGLRRLDPAGEEVSRAVAAVLAGEVDRLLGKQPPAGSDVQPDESPAHADAESMIVATCACGSGITVATINVNGDKMEIIALPTIFEMFQEEGKSPGSETADELMDMVRIYNPISDEQEPALREAILREYAVYCGEKTRS
jgi:uncharacterized metal-binding protein